LISEKKTKNTYSRTLGGGGSSSIDGNFQNSVVFTFSCRWQHRTGVLCSWTFRESPRIHVSCRR